MVVIADTSPLSYVIRIERIEILPELFERIVIPAMVFGELNHSRIRRSLPGDLVCG